MDIYLTNARVYTFDDRQPLADSIAIHQGRVSAVGRAADILPPGTKRKTHDLHGQVIIPGLVDAHLHLLEYGLSLARVDCETPARSACLERLQTRTAAARPGEWVLGHGWNHNIWADGIGSKSDLDAIFPQNPVYLTHKSLHSAWANSTALRAAGIQTETPDPDGGRIGRDAAGGPDGILYESAMRLVEKAIPEPDARARRAALQAGQDALLSLGITTAHDFDAWACFQTLQEMDTSGELRLRVVKNIPSDHLQEAIALGLKSGQGSPFLRIGWLKLFADGALGPQTAAMLQPYEGSHSLGMLFMESSQIVEVGRQALNAGINLAIHAIGDRANREVLDGYEKLAGDNYFQQANLPPRIEHVQLIQPADTARLAALGVIASMQPIHAVSDRDMADRHWGRRCANAYAWRSLLKSGARLIFGSDAPVESPNPFLGLHAAVTRHTTDTLSDTLAWYPEQRLDIKDALRAYTCRLPDHLDSAQISAGSPADLVVLPMDIFQENPCALAECRPTGAMVAGKWVYTAT